MEHIYARIGSNRNWEYGHQIQLMSIQLGFYPWLLQIPKLISVPTRNTLNTFKNKALEAFVIVLRIII